MGGRGRQGREGERGGRRGRERVGEREGDGKGMREVGLITFHCNYRCKWDGGESQPFYNPASQKCEKECHTCTCKNIKFPTPDIPHPQ